MDRYLKRSIENDALAANKMAFVSGPRQVGKTTLAKSLLHDDRNYFTWDDQDFQTRWVKSPRQSIAHRGDGPVVLDELHKDRKFKTRLKGLFDTLETRQNFIVTGSARLDVFRHGSDSLMGRYFPYRLHPFSVGESTAPPAPETVLENLSGGSKARFTVDALLHLGGFPEPLFGASEARAVRWSRLRLERLVTEDLRDLRAVHDLNAFSTLTSLLAQRAGGLLSINALREDMQTAHGTVKAWIAALESLYYCFLLKPYAKRIARALTSEPKLYLFDILRIDKKNTGARRENLVALHLLKASQYWTDTAAGEFELRFVRDKEKREVDFLLTRDGAPWMLVECKSNTANPSASLQHFAKKLSVPLVFQLCAQRIDRSYPGLGGLRVLNDELFLSAWV